MKICKAIKVCRKLAKAASPDVAADHRVVLRGAKTLLDRFDDELAARSESTSIRQAALAIAAARVRRAAGVELERLAELAASHLSTRAVQARKDEESAVAIVRMLAWNIRAVRPAVRVAPRKTIAAALRLA